MSELLKGLPRTDAHEVSRVTECARQLRGRHHPLLL